MKYLFLLIILPLQVCNAQVQHDWTVVHHPFGFPGFASVTPDQVLTTSSGDVITSWNLSSASNPQGAICISSYSAAGILNWEDSLMGTYSQVNVHDLSMDSLENFYLQGVIDYQHSQQHG